MLQPIPDYLAQNLKIIFVGYNPSIRSGETGHHFANPNNRFWTILHRAGLTPRKYAPEEDQTLLQLGYGLTNIVPRPTKAAANITEPEYQTGREELHRKISAYRPLVVCFVGKGVYEKYSGRQNITWGRQAEQLVPGVIDYVAPSSSGLVRMNLDEVVDIFSGLQSYINPLQVAVVGGGAAGLTAAIAAAAAGAKVTVLEQLERVGKKILATGNGRCNLSNTDLELEHYHGTNPRFAYSALSRFDFSRTMDFFESLGIAWKVEADGKVFPMSDQASSVLDVLRYQIKTLGVEVRCASGVTKIKGREGDFTLELADGSQLNAHRVIIATGGRAAPNLGADGSGYSLARQLGHSVVEPFPALVPLKLAAGFLKSISGVKFTGSATVLAGDRPIKTAAGEILFTDYGVSGPPILALSRAASEYLHKSEVWLTLNLFNAMSPDELRQLVDRRLATQAGKSLAFSFVGLINKRLIPVLLQAAGIKEQRKPAGQITGAEREAVQSILQDWRFEVTGARAWPSAQVTAGGVNVSEVEPKTMASKLAPGIYFAGELLDIDGDCGGYNLQWAWSSGFTAGASAAAEQTKQ